MSHLNLDKNDEDNLDKYDYDNENTYTDKKMWQTVKSITNTQKQNLGGFCLPISGVVLRRYIK